MSFDGSRNPEEPAVTARTSYALKFRGGLSAAAMMDALNQVGAWIWRGSDSDRHGDHLWVIPQQGSVMFAHEECYHSIASDCRGRPVRRLRHDATDRDDVLAAADGKLPILWVGVDFRNGSFDLKLLEPILEKFQLQLFREFDDGGFWGGA